MNSTAFYLSIGGLLDSERNKYTWYTTFAMTASALGLQIIGLCSYRKEATFLN